jgi:RND family efflux transporter MFP subunit
MAPVYEDRAAAAESSIIAVDPVTIQTMGIRTSEVMRGPLRRTVRTVATIDHSEAAMADVTTKFKGWVEKLYVDTTGQQVHRGDPLFEIYSPELYSAEVEYLLALNQSSESVPGTTALRETAATKLKFFDISAVQITELEKTRQPRKTLQITAPIDGYVMEKMVVEGQMVDAGMKLYRLVNHDTVWVQAQIFEQDIPFIRPGQEAAVTLGSWPGLSFRGRVAFIYPTLDEKTRTATVRTEFHNPGHLLKPGMFATVTITAEIKPSTLLVPDSAVLRGGQRNIVFVALDGGKFEPRTVSLGPSSENDAYEVLDGLREGERVVTSGQFMLDSESQLREAIQKMRAPHAPQPMEQTSATSLPGPTQETTTQATARKKKLVYLCPMPEHVSIEYDHAGTCPICGMTLVPVSPELLARIYPGGTLLYYTCPMAEHSDVHSEKPGKCPRCGMTLFPFMAPPQTTGTATNVHAAPLPATLYTCPMAVHGDVVSDKPGKCPKCGMDLVPATTVKHAKLAEENWRKQHPSGESPAAVHQH